MSDNDDEEFEYLISNMDECKDDGGKGEIIDFENIFEVIQHFWKQFYPGQMYVKGFLIVESADGDGRSLNLLSPGLSDWEVFGMLETARLDRVGKTLFGLDDITDDDDDQDIEDDG